MVLQAAAAADSAICRSDYKLGGRRRREARVVARRRFSRLRTSRGVRTPGRLLRPVLCVSAPDAERRRPMDDAAVRGCTRTPALDDPDLR